MFDKLRKLGFTAYGKVGKDAIKVSLAILPDGREVYVREDGTNSVVPFRPTLFLTVGTVANVTGKMGIVNTAQLPWADVATAHEWKRPVTFLQLATRQSFLGWTEKDVRAHKAALKAAYNDLRDEDLIAA